MFRLYGRTAPDRRAEWVVAVYGDTLHTSADAADARELTAADALIAADLAYRRGFAEVHADAPRIGWTAASDTYRHATGRLTLPRCKAGRGARVSRRTVVDACAHTNHTPTRTGRTP